MTDDIDEKAKPYLRIYTLGENKWKHLKNI
jgi:hypothetical protein